MQIRVGYKLLYDCPQPTPMILTLPIHHAHVADIVVPDHLITTPSIPVCLAVGEEINSCCCKEKEHCL